jgi:Fe-S cluster biosynthesis and repair protein YggX
MSSLKSRFCLHQWHIEEYEMTRMVNCKKLGKELPGLEFAPLKNELGEKIYQEISQEAWKEWLKHSTMVINENRLNPAESKAQEMLSEQMYNFFFGDGVEAVEGFVAITPAAEPAPEE